MADVYNDGPFADISSFVADGNAINAATKTALNLALTNISGLFTPASGQSAAHPDFNHISPLIQARVNKEITALKTAITNHA